MQQTVVGLSGTVNRSWILVAHMTLFELCFFESEKPVRNPEGRICFF